MHNTPEKHIEIFTTISDPTLHLITMFPASITNRAKTFLLKILKGGIMKVVVKSEKLKAVAT